MTESTTDGIRKLKFYIGISIRYHSKRRRFFENCHSFTSVCVAITGSSAFAALWSNNNENHLALILTGVVAFLTSLDSVFSFSKRAKIHDDLQKRFSALQRDICVGEACEEKLNLWQAEKVMIESEAPTGLKALALFCQNEESVFQGYGDDEIYHLGWLRTKLKDFWSFDSYVLKTVETYKNEQAAKLTKYG